MASQFDSALDSGWLAESPHHDLRQGAAPWTPDEWRAIVFYASVVRNPTPLPVHRLSARGASAYAARRLRDLALQTEIDGVRSCL